MQTRSTTIEQGTPTASFACPDTSLTEPTRFVISDLPHEKERSVNVPEVSVEVSISSGSAGEDMPQTAHFTEISATSEPNGPLTQSRPASNTGVQFSAARSSQGDRRVRRLRHAITGAISANSAPVQGLNLSWVKIFDFLRAVVDTGLTTMVELVKSSLGITTEPHSLRSRLSLLGTDLCGKSKPQAIVRRRTSMFPTTEAPRSKKTRPAFSPFGRVCHFQPTYNVSEHPCGTVDQMPISPIHHPLDRAGSGAEKKSEISRTKCHFLPSSVTRYGTMDVFRKGDSARSGGLTSRNERTPQSLWAFTVPAVKQVPRGSFTRFRKGSNGSTNRLSHLHG